ncbi:ATP-dependent endonuclease [Planomicrobium sp. CPCC 101079]|uniref:ATP-dependent nuclease n=1 Tax=Planomicrobium sp. CPCC 101079 TaxID=2599618 RepID=UPI0011B3BE49|nr:AAA family ATPase [Planomicrobium sp. CPCC 101079]TWT05863.1 AAA family ATPase [Planomicrobium sp. CPCC 101079]
MKLREIEIKGWRSFSQTGIRLSDLKKINLLIGPNNSGKTNILRYFNKLKKLFYEKDSPELILHSSINVEETWMNLSEDVCCKFQFEVGGAIHEFENLGSVRGRTNKFIIDGYENIKTFNTWRKLILDTIRIFSDVRGYQKNTAGILEPHLEGVRVADRIYYKGTRDIEWYKGYQNKMSSWLSSLLDADVKLDIALINSKYQQSPYVKDNIVERENEVVIQGLGPTFEHAKFEIKIKRGSTIITQEPHDLGMGVLQFILILSALYEQKDFNRIVFIEEPEINLHAKSIVDLIKILENDVAFEKHQYFFITHSNSILDRINENFSVQKFSMDANGATEVTSCTNTIDNYKILDLLGVKASHLLLSNLVIWVEGPSDRIYVKKWIDSYAAQKGKIFEEGKHYSFVFYGGALLDHYTVLKEEKDVDNLIDFLKISRFSIIICDSDLGSSRSEYKNRVRKIKERLDERTELEGYVYQWITDGREIENYLPKDLLTRVIYEKIPHRKHFRYDKEKRIHYFDEPNPEMVRRRDFNLSYSFDEFFSLMYIREKELGDDDLEKAIIKTVSRSFDKIDIADKATQLWDEMKNNNPSLDLHMEKVIELLIAANE